MPPSTQPQTCIAEEFLWCYDPAGGHDKVYVSRVYERNDGKFVHRYMWGRRGSTLTPQEDVHSNRAVALQAHNTKVWAKRNGKKGSRYDTCQPSQIGLAAELNGPRTAAGSPPAGVPVQPAGSAMPALPDFSLRAARNAAHQQFGESMGERLVSAIQTVQHDSRQGIFPRAALAELEREISRLAGTLSITKPQLARRIRLYYPLPPLGSEFRFWAAHCEDLAQGGDDRPWEQVVRSPGLDRRAVVDSPKLREGSDRVYDWDA